MTIAPVQRATSRGSVDPETWSERVELMETMARKALQDVKGVRRGRLWITGPADSAIVNAHVEVATPAALPGAVTAVADDLVEVLEYILGGSFQRHDLDFTIAGTDTQNLTIT